MERAGESIQEGTRQSKETGDDGKLRYKNDIDHDDTAGNAQRLYYPKDPRNYSN
jgi:hypothetical protein